MKHATTGKPERMSDRARMAAIGLGGTLAAFVLFGGLRGVVKSGSSDPLDAMPRGSFIAATVDLTELRRSPLYAMLAKDGAAADPIRHALGADDLAKACGFDPMTRVERLALSMPEEGERGEFGVAARVSVTREELERCTRALEERNGGHAETRDVGSFVVLEGLGSRGAKRGDPSKEPRLAYGRGGLLVVGKGTWFDAILGAADGTKPGLRDATEHVALRQSLSREGSRPPTILATAILPRALRDRLKGDMGAEVGAQDGSAAAMTGVLGVASIGVAIRTGEANVEATVELVCEAAAACDTVEKLVQKKRLEWSRDLTLRMVGLGPLLDSFEVKRDGLRLRATASANAASLASTLERVMKIRARHTAAADDAAPTRLPDAKPPTETIPAPRGPGRNDAGP